MQIDKISTPPPVFLLTTQRLVQFFLASSLSVSLIHHLLEDWDFSRRIRFEQRLHDERSGLCQLREFFRSTAETSLRQAEVDLLAMAHSDAGSVAISCHEIGPEMLMAIFMLWLHHRPLIEDDDDGHGLSFEDMYVEYLSNMVSFKPLSDA